MACGSIACVEETPAPDPSALAGFRVTILDSALLGAAPYEFISQLTPVQIQVEALLNSGERKTDYTGTVQLRMVPGETDEESRFVRLENGVSATHDLRFRYAFGSAEIWAEEVGIDQFDECHDGFDNDGNGLVDFPGDPGCFATEDPSEGSATYVTGLSDALQFTGITVRNIQFNPDDLTGDSPLLGEEVVVERGELLVTNVTFDGFFIQDMADDGYNGLFLFNFNFPDGLRLGDRLLRFAGGVAEFQGGTQLTFPSWDIDPDYVLADADRAKLARCEPLNDPTLLEAVPVLLEPADLSDLELLETYESTMVRAENVSLTNTFIDCDVDQSGRINGNDELRCRDICQENLLCTELSSFIARDQFAGSVQGAQIWISGAKRVALYDAFGDCEPVEGEEFSTWSCPERTLAGVAGNLRHIFLTSRIQLWILYPRFACDLAFSCETSADCPNERACVSNLCE